MSVSSSAIDFHELVELTGDAIIVREITGQVRFWNRGAERLYGFTAGVHERRPTVSALGPPPRP